MPTNENLAEETDRLRRLMREVVALSTLPAVWASYGPREIASSLAEVLVNTLALDVLYIRLEPGEGADALEVARGRARTHDAGELRAIARALEACLEADAADPASAVRNPLGDGVLRTAVARFGYTGDIGVLVAGSERPDFPAESDRLLLGIGANQGATLIRQKRLEAELRRVAADLVAANRRKDEFLATLAHELRNPLAPIRTGLELMKIANVLPDSMEEIRRTMERQVLQMVRLIDDLMDVSRITQGKVELRKCPVQVRDVVQSAVEASRPLIDEAGHELSVSLPPEPILLDADPHRLAQVLSNLLNNAAKYTPHGGKISLAVEPAGSEVVLSVKDTGVGIPAEHRQHIFEMFGQIDRPLEKGYTGLGIGLTLVRAMVELHGGRIDVHSDGPDQGSEFRLRFPILVDSSVDPPQRNHPADPRAVSTPRHRVLVVDDNEAGAVMLSELVRMLGNEVRTACDGQEAIAIAAEFRPEMIVMDIGMPVMNGYEVARHIRQQPWGEHMMLVALTGWGQYEDKERTKHAGFDYHLVKPAEPSELRPLLAKLKDKAGA